MRAMSYSESRQRYAEVLDSVVDDCDEVVITRSGKPSAVIISLREYESLKETAYLLGTPVNARRLLNAVSEIAAGNVTEHPLLDAE